MKIANCSVNSVIKLIRLWSANPIGFHVQNTGNSKEKIVARVRYKRLRVSREHISCSVKVGGVDIRKPYTEDLLKPIGLAVHF